jgi:hypothetical protein
VHLQQDPTFMPHPRWFGISILVMILGLILFLTLVLVPGFPTVWVSAQWIGVLFIFAGLGGAVISSGAAHPWRQATAIAEGKRAESEDSSGSPTRK